MERDAEQGIVEIERLGDVDVIRLLGEHDMATAANVADVVGRSIASERGVVVSLADTEFVDSGVVNLLFRSDRMLRERG